MKIKILGIIFFLNAIIPQIWATSQYSVKFIPDSLKKNSNVFVWENKLDVEVNENSHSITESRTFTILNKESENEAYLLFAYDITNKITSIKGHICDENGIVYKTFSKKDFADVSLTSAATTFSDDRALVYHANYRKFPYTINYTLEEKVTSNLSLPSWYILKSFKESVLNSSFSITYPENALIRRKLVNCTEENINLKIFTLKGNTTITASANNIPAIKDEDYAPFLLNVLPFVLFAPSNFTYDKTQGEMTSWKSFGIWLWNLAKDRQELLPGSKEILSDLLLGCGSKTDTIKVLYKDLQSNTRYVSIQLGIGGWQPFPASEVQQNEYGDCKALSNYMVSLLKNVGIESFMAVIGNGSLKINHLDFPSLGQTNHVIVCVPSPTDTIWLECTNQQYPFRYIGYGNSNRYALLIKPEGGCLVKTPKINQINNLQLSNINLSIDTLGNGNIKSRITFEGYQISNELALAFSNETDKRSLFLNKIPISSPQLKELKHKIIERDTASPFLIHTSEIQAPGYSKKAGDSYIFNPNVLNRLTNLPNGSERTLPIYHSYSYTDIDTITIDIPNEFGIEALPKETNIISKYGQYHTECIFMNSGKIKYIRKFSRAAGTWPKEEYADFNNFLKSVYKADRYVIVIKKKAQV